MLNLAEAVTHEHDRASVPPELIDTFGALALETLVADRQHLVDEQHVGLNVGGHGESEAHEHARRVVLDRCVDELFESGEVDDVVEPSLDVLLRESENGAVQKHVLASGEFGMEAGAELEESRQASGDGDASFVGNQNSGQTLEERALSRTVRSDHPEGGSLRHVERHTFQRPEGLVAGAATAQDRGLQRLIAFVIEAEVLPDLVHHDCFAHSPVSLADAH